MITGHDLAVLGQSRGATPAAGGPEAVVKAALVLVAEARHGLPGELAAIGVGAPGRIDRTTGVVAQSPNLAGWLKPFGLGAELSRSLRAPVVVDNDVRAALLGEYRLGCGRPFTDLLGVWFGTGVGGALILDGGLRRGSTGASGEIGHMAVRRRGRRCGCGRRGCLEAYAGRASMERRAHKLVARGRSTELFEIMRGGGKDHLTSGVIAQALAAGDRLARGLVDDAVGAAGIAIASALNLLDVEAVIIGGGVGARLGVPFADRITEAMQPHLLAVGGSRATMLVTALGDLGGALGAACQAADLTSLPAATPQPAGGARRGSAGR